MIYPWECRRRFVAPAETRYEAAERHYRAAVVAWDVHAMAAYADELAELERDALFEAIYHDDEPLEAAA